MLANSASGQSSMGGSIFAYLNTRTTDAYYRLRLFTESSHTCRNVYLLPWHQVIRTLSNYCSIAIKYNIYFTYFIMTELNHSILGSLYVHLEPTYDSQSRHCRNHVEVSSFPGSTCSTSTFRLIKINRKACFKS